MATNLSVFENSKKSLHYHSFTSHFESMQIRNTKFNDKTILDGTVIMYDIFGR